MTQTPPSDNGVPSQQPSESGMPSQPDNDTPPQLTQQQAIDFLLHVNSSDPDFDQTFSMIFNTEEGVAAAEQVLSMEVQRDTLWAATTLYASVGPDVTPLRKLLSNNDITIRVIASGGVLARGDVSGFAPLIQALIPNGWLYGSEPPLPIWQAATQLLVRATAISELGPPFDADEEQIEQATLCWQQWFETNHDHLQFDIHTGKWSIIP